MFQVQVDSERKYGNTVIRFELVAKRGSLALTEPNRESETTRRKKVSYFDEGLNIIITHINK